MAALAMLCAFGGVQSGDLSAQTTDRYSLVCQNTEGNGTSSPGGISANGKLLVFLSQASNFVLGDTNGSQDVFVQDIKTRAPRRVSVATDGTQANNNSGGPDISGNGRFVVFNSLATNLVADDTNGLGDVFLHDLKTSTTRRVSLGVGGVEANAVCNNAAVSGSGRIVAFVSSASNLVPGDTNGVKDVFVVDTKSGSISRVSVKSDGSQGNANSVLPALSANGRLVVFGSDASNLVNGDTNGVRDCLVHDRKTGLTWRVSVSTSGVATNGAIHGPTISANGKVVAFGCIGSNLVNNDTNGQADIFVHDLKTAETKRVSLTQAFSQANGASSFPRLSGNGRVVAFTSTAVNLLGAGGDTNGVSDIFVRDLVTGAVTRVNAGDADGTSSAVLLSANGRYALFQSNATNLSLFDLNGVADVFRTDLKK